MKVDPFNLIRQEIFYLNSRIDMLKEELASNWNSESSKYITQKDLNQAISELENIKEEIRMFAEEFTK